MEIKITKVNNGYLIEWVDGKIDKAHSTCVASSVEEMEKVVGKIAVYGFLNDSIDFTNGNFRIIVIYGSN